MVAILVAAPAVRWVMHETAESILAAFHAPMLEDAGAASVDEFEGTDEYAEAVRREGIWGFTDTKTAPPSIHLWIPRDTPEHVVAHLVGHELGHAMLKDKPTKADALADDCTPEEEHEAIAADETEADEFGAVAEATVEFMARWRSGA